MENMEAQGERSVIVGRDIINSIIVTGDHNKFFISSRIPRQLAAGMNNFPDNR
jgi:hypothetical protein